MLKQVHPDLGIMNSIINDISPALPERRKACQVQQECHSPRSGLILYILLEHQRGLQEHCLERCLATLLLRVTRLLAVTIVRRVSIWQMLVVVRAVTAVSLSHIVACCFAVLIQCFQRVFLRQAFDATGFELILNPLVSISVSNVVTVVIASPSSE